MFDKYRYLCYCHFLDLSFKLQVYYDRLNSTRVAFNLIATRIYLSKKILSKRRKNNNIMLMYHAVCIHYQNIS